MSLTQMLPLSKITTFQDQGEIAVTDFADVAELKEYVRKKPNYVVIGKGSKIIINPAQKAKHFLRLSPFLIPTEIHENKLTISAGNSGAKILEICKNNQLAGLEFMAGIPVTLGGMIAMNFGAFGWEIGQFLESVYYLNEKGEDAWRVVQKDDFGYRRSIFRENNWLILGAVLRLQKDTKEHIQEKISAYIKQRHEKQPLNARTFGSIFKNPEIKSAGELLDQLGFKGRTYKNLEISNKHANFLINKGNSTFEDIITFLELIQKEVHAKTGVDLQPEVRIIT